MVDPTEPIRRAATPAALRTAYAEALRAEDAGVLPHIAALRSVFLERRSSLARPAPAAPPSLDDVAAPDEVRGWVLGYFDPGVADAALVAKHRALGLHADRLAAWLPLRTGWLAALADGSVPPPLLEAVERRMLRRGSKIANLLTAPGATEAAHRLAATRPALLAAAPDLLDGWSPAFSARPLPRAPWPGRSPTATQTPSRKRGYGWLVPIALILLLSNLARCVEPQGRPSPMPDFRSPDVDTEFPHHRPEYEELRRLLENSNPRPPNPVPNPRTTPPPTPPDHGSTPPR
jgi:hypothetical protein